MEPANAHVQATVARLRRFLHPLATPDCKTGTQDCSEQANARGLPVSFVYPHLLPSAKDSRPNPCNSSRHAELFSSRSCLIVPIVALTLLSTNGRLTCRRSPNNVPPSYSPTKAISVALPVPVSCRQLVALIPPASPSRQNLAVGWYSMTVYVASIAPHQARRDSRITAPFFIVSPGVSSALITFESHS